MNEEQRQRVQFYGALDSSSTYRCRIAFNLKGMRYDFHPVDLRKGEQKTAEFAAINPQRMVPALITPGGAHLTQSLAILEWLEERRPNPPLLARNTNTRAQERAFVHVIACEIQPMQVPQVRDYLTNSFGANEEQTGAWLRHWIGEGLRTCEALLAKLPGSFDFCFGRTPGMADVCLVPQLHAARRFGVDVSGFNRLTAIEERCNKLSPFKKAHPDWRPDSGA